MSTVSSWWIKIIGSHSRTQSHGRPAVDLFGRNRFSFSVCWFVCLFFFHLFVGFLLVVSFFLRVSSCTRFSSNLQKNPTGNPIQPDPKCPEFESSFLTRRSHLARRVRIKNNNDNKKAKTWKSFWKKNKLRRRNTTRKRDTQTKVRRGEETKVELKRNERETSVKRAPRLLTACPGRPVAFLRRPESNRREISLWRHPTT